MTDRAAKTDAVLSAFSGTTYRWGERDCLAISSAVAEALTGVPISPTVLAAEYQYKTVPALVESALQRYGSCEGWFRAVLLSHPHASEIVDASAQPGDLVVIGGAIRAEGCDEEYSPMPPLTAVGACQGSHGLFAWLPVQPGRAMRLLPLQPGCDQLLTVRFAEAPPSR